MSRFKSVGPGLFSSLVAEGLRIQLLTLSQLELKSLPIDLR